MIQLRVIYDFQNGMDRASLRVFGAVNQPPNARVDERSGTHRARLDGGVDLAVRQTMVAESSGRLAQGNNFGMGGGVVIQQVAVEAAPYGTIIANDYSSNRHLTGVQRALGEAQRLFHPDFIGVRPVHNATTVHSRRKLWWLNIFSAAANPRLRSGF